MSKLVNAVHCNPKFGLLKLLNVLSENVHYHD